MHPNLTPIRFENALWEGYLSATEKPQVKAVYQGEPLPDVELRPEADGWSLRIPVPPAVLSDGVHCVMIFDAATDHKLGDFTIVAGAPAADDIHAQIALLRAELDMLKRAFRRSQAAQDAR